MINWLFTYTPVLLLGLTLLLLLRRQGELKEYAQSHHELADAKDRGSYRARLQHPDIDLAKCIGCGTCIKACPEDGVLKLMHGQAIIVHGARCVGHGLCATACPTGAIGLTLGDLSDRRDLPALKEDLEVVGLDGLYLAGELGGFALVTTAVKQGIAVADAVAKRIKDSATNGQASEGATGESSDVVDFLIIGAGPGGVACSLRAKELDLNFVTIEQEEKIGGTVASYPRRKMVMTQPVVLPLHGKLPKLTYQKEELVEIWEQTVSTCDLPIRTGVRLTELSRDADGVYQANTSNGIFRAHNVCMALGRRGTPRKLGAPGEDLPKVAYSLLDAESYQGRRILVVGGGDSAIEAAVGLSEQPGNEVTLSYRKKALFRLKAKNEARIEQALHEGKVQPLFNSQVTAVEPESVRLEVTEGDKKSEVVLPNDEVFVFAGGIPPFALLEKAGVSFDPKDRPPPAELVDKNMGLLIAVSTVLFAAVAIVGWTIWHRAYYHLDIVLRASSTMHEWLRPAGQEGVLFGVLACGLFIWNLAYLLRRSSVTGPWVPGTLKFWMSSHIFTGLLGFLCVLLHCGFSLRQTTGGHALLALTIVVVTGVIGRYLYAYVPRAANGTAVDIEELRTRLASLSGEWDRDGRGFGTRVHEAVEHLITAGRWRPSLWARIWVLLIGQIRLRRTLARLWVEGRKEDIPDNELRHILEMAKKAYRLTLMVVHYEEIRAILSSWRYLHRWLALLMVILAVIHIVIAVRYAHIDWGMLGLIWGGSKP